MITVRGVRSCFFRVKHLRAEVSLLLKQTHVDDRVKRPRLHRGPLQERRALNRSLGIIAVVAALLVGGYDARAQTELEQWSFTAAEIEVAYRYQELFGERIQRPLRARECLLGRDSFIATYRGMEFAAPCRFITETIRHLKEMLVTGAARYFFPLDADHAHLAVPLQLWESKYRKLSYDTLLPELVAEPALAALYHTAEHLALGDPRKGRVDPLTRRWKENRNVVGYYDGRPIIILPPEPRGIGATMPPPYYSVGSFNFLASRQGELNLFHDRQVITFDITFDTGYVAGDAPRVQIRAPDVVR